MDDEEKDKNKKSLKNSLIERVWTQERKVQNLLFNGKEHNNKH